jgi:hypothetical protein
MLGYTVTALCIRLRSLMHNKTSAIEHFNTAGQLPLGQVSYTEVLKC